MSPSSNEAQPSPFDLVTTRPNPDASTPTLLANGYVAVESSPRGTDATNVFVAGLMDRTPGDVSRPAAIPSWQDVDVFNGDSWLNSTPIPSPQIANYRQILKMREGVLETSYTWTSGGRTVAISVTTFVDQANPHLAVTSVALTPDFSGLIQLNAGLRRLPALRTRLALAELTWEQLKDELAKGTSTQPTTQSPGERPRPPAEILTWYDLQAALAAEGRELVRLRSTEPTRAALWYPGEVALDAQRADLVGLTLSAEGRAIHGPSFSVAVAVSLPAGFDSPSVSIWQNEHGVGIDVSATVKAGQTYVVEKYASISRGGWSEGVSADLERARNARNRGRMLALDSHRSAWAQLWKADLEIDGDDNLQRVVRSDLFQLFQMTNGDFAWGMGACGLGLGYYGHVFWDCDAWVFPVLLLFHPDRARKLVDFRHRTLDWAKENARRHGYAGAMFPWEADVDNGTEQTPRFARVNAEKEILVNGMVAIAQWQYYLATGDLAWLRSSGFPVIEATAEFWLSRATLNPDRRVHEILQVTSVDEKYTAVDNDAFTNAIAKKNLEIAVAASRVLGVPPNPLWVQVAGSLLIPFNAVENRHLMFDESVRHDRATWMAGALTFLCHPSVDLAMSEEVLRNNYDYALRKIAEASTESNQMMTVILGTHAAMLGDAEAARTWMNQGHAGFLKPPFNLRSETPQNNCTHHLASGTGFLQCLLMGFTGLRLTEDGLVNKYQPVLPKSWRSLTVRGVRLRGERCDVVVERGPDGAVILRKTAIREADSSAHRHRALRQLAESTLDQNWRAGFTIPSRRLYPFQWNWDSGFIALGLATYRPDRAVEEIRSMFKGQWKNGMLPHIVFHRPDPNYFPGPEVWATESAANRPEGIATSGISQPPVYAFVMQRIANRAFGRTKIWQDFEREMFPKLLALHRYLYTHRDPQGEALVSIYHNWEAGTDNSPAWDPVLESLDISTAPDIASLRRDIHAVDPAHRPTHANYQRYIHLLNILLGCGYSDSEIAAKSPFMVQDVLFNSLLVQSNHALIALANRLGESIPDIIAWNERTVSAINTKLWDPESGFYYSYDLRQGRRLPVKTSSGFMPLFAGVSSEAQANRLALHLKESFSRGQDWRLCASTAIDEPAFEALKYWRGPIWINLNWMIHLGLVRYGFDDLAKKVRSDTLELLAAGGLYEYFDARPPSTHGGTLGLGSDSFSWSAALALDLLDTP